MPLLNRFWSWTSAPGNAPLNIGPLRGRAWTNGAAAAVAPLSLGALRFSPWTSGPAAPSVAPLSLGPLRFSPWTFGPPEEVVVVPPTPSFGVQLFPRFGVDRTRLLLEDEELIPLLLAWLQATTKGR